MSDYRPGGDHEDSSQRLNRELIELLNELRVVLPGVQVLFAFLLTVPFTHRFPELTTAERAVYFICFVATTIASIFFIAPTSQHRLRWRARDKEQLLRRSNGLAIAGMVFLTVAIATAVYLVAEFVYANAAADIVTAVVVAVIGWFWFGQPLVRKIQEASAEQRRP